MLDLKKEEDRQLVNHYLNGNEPAFEVLVNRYKHQIYQRIYLIVREKTVAEDILQDCFIKIVQSIKSGVYHEKGKFLPWALIIARNLCLDYKRKMKYPKHFYSDVFFPEYCSKDASFGKCRISERQLLEQIESILNQLPDEQRTVIKYRHFEEMSFKQISMAMGTSISTTIGRMRYGLRSMNRLIGENRSVFQ